MPQNKKTTPPEPIGDQGWFATLRLLADPTRLRIMAVLQRESLSVAEIQEALDLGQSRISTHLGLLRQGGLLADRREGKQVFYSWADGEEQEVVLSMIQSASEQPAIAEGLRLDRENLALILRRRREESERYFSNLAGRAAKNYCPGRSWHSLAAVFSEMLTNLDIADLGAGEGLVSHLLARRARSVIAVDISEKMVKVARDHARQLRLKNLEFRVGDIEAPPIAPESVDVALLSQALHHAAHPSRAIESAARILRPGGRLVILDLKQHSFDAARELYSDTWLGFREVDVMGWLKGAGLSEASVTLLDRESEPPHFQPLLASALKR